jgi:hypothetical protein
MVIISLALIIFAVRIEISKNPRTTSIKFRNIIADILGEKILDG